MKLDEFDLVVGDDGELQTGDFEVPEKPKRKRKPFRRPIRFLLIGVVGSTLTILSLIGGVSLYYLVRSNSVALTPCRLWLEQINGGGNAIIFRVTDYSEDRYGSLEDITIISMDGRRNTNTPGRYETSSLDLSDDQTNVVVARWNASNLTNMIYTWSLESAARNERQLTEGSDPVWSRDGSQIAFLRPIRSAGAALYVMNSDGTGIQEVTRLYEIFPPISWSPDGSKLVFSALEDENAVRNLYVINTDGTDRHQLTDNSLTMEYPAWSPDGKRIAYVSGDIYTINLDGTDRRNLTNGEFMNVSYPQWSTDSKSIVFLGRQNVLQAIYRMDDDGAGLQIIYQRCPV